MRTSCVLAFYVSLAAVCLANTPGDESKTAPEWRKTYDAAFEANQQQHFDEAVALLRKSWDRAESDEERGVVATDLGQTYRQLGRTKDAAQWFERALETWRRDSLRSDPRQSLMSAVTAVDLADSSRDIGDYERAERVLREGLTFTASDPAPKALVRNNLADLLREEGRSAEAEPLFRETLENPVTEPRDRAGALVGLADIDRQRGAWNSSIERWNQALDIHRSQQDSKSEAIALRGLAMTWLDSGSPARAEPLLKRSVQMLENLPGAPPEQLASALSSMAELYRSENKFTLAENEFSRALQIDRKQLGDSHPQVAWLMEMLAEVISARGDFTLARDFASRATDTMCGVFGDDSMPAAVALANRALIEERANHTEDATHYYERAIGIARSHPANRTLYATMLNRYAVFLKGIHRGREAKALALEARSFQPR
jgi:tetratricopeptide (TPR) repeat protein